MISKICSKCKIEKLISEFSKRSARKIGTASMCKSCFKEYRILNKDQIKKRSKKYKLENKKIISKYNTIYNKKYHLAHKEDISTRKKSNYIKNRDKIIKLRKNNKLITNKRDRDRKLIDPAYKLRKNVSAVVFQALKKVNSSKFGKSILQFLPYTIQNLKDHLEKQFKPWMTWSNWGKYNYKTWDDNDPSTWTWQIDHVIPQSNLLYISMEDDNFQKCWALSNLRPYSAKLNIIEGPSKIRHNF